MLELRQAVLREPLGLKYSPADLAAETDQRHFVVVDRSGSGDVVGCALLVETTRPVAKVRQVAVAASMQGRGLGKVLMTGVESAAAASGFAEIQLHARETAIPFYQRIGYVVTSETFVEVGLPHVAMRKVLEGLE